MNASLPLALTQGDPCGIGPEIVAMQWLSEASALGPDRVPAFVVGCPEVMRRALSWLTDRWPEAARVVVQPLTALAPLGGRAPGGSPRTLPVWVPPGMPAHLTRLPVGRVHRDAGLAAALSVREAARLVMAGQARALVTAPLHKEALSAAGEPFPGHTEMLQSLATPVGQPLVPVRMMLASPELRTVLVSIHVSLRQALEAVTFERVLDTVRITHDSLVRMGVAHPRVAVAGLNPHAGEGGLFGDEEVTAIAPAVAAAQAAGIDASGPWAPDTVFMRARHAPGHPGEFDAVVAMYHDQGLIPVKYLGVAHGVNVTLGLPFVRTSPDHGTAFDLAGRALADPSSLGQAIDLALALTGGRA